jgi:hypothetical protein
MKPNLIQLVLIITLFTFSCGHKQSKEMKQTVDKLNTMTSELKTKFTGNVDFQSIMFSFDPSFGNTILVKVVEHSDSAKIKEWFYINGEWDLTSEKIMDTDSAIILNHTFSINNDYDLSKLTEILDLASQKLKEEKDINKVVFKSINLLMGNQPESKNKMENLITQITVESIAEKKSYFMNFDVEGNFVSISE